MLIRYMTSSIGKKQIVAVSGLLLVLYLMFHLSMNLLLYGGPELYNMFPEKAEATGLLLKIIESLLALVFIAHIGFTIACVLENRRARTPYEVSASSKKRSLATRLMPYTGTILLLFLIQHLRDYKLVDHHGMASFINGQDLGLYGLVFNSFLNPLRSAFYIVAMFAVGFHLAHGIQSVLQSFGFNHPYYTPIIQKVSTGVGLLFAVLFSSIPVYVFAVACTMGCP